MEVVSAVHIHVLKMATLVCVRQMLRSNLLTLELGISGFRFRWPMHECGVRKGTGSQSVEDNVAKYPGDESRQWVL